MTASQTTPTITLPDPDASASRKREASRAVVAAARQALDRAYAVIERADFLAIEITAEEAITIALADPTDTESLADAISDSAHVPLIVSAHPECRLRDDGCVVPEGRLWEVGSEGHYNCYDSTAEDDVNDNADDVAEAHRGDAAGWDGYDRSSTTWIDVEVRLAVVNKHGYAEYLTGSVEVVIQPDEPGCSHADGHDWEEGDVYGSGGGVQWRSTCRHCGLVRHTDTWATRPDNGTQGHTSVRYYHDDDLDDLD